MKHIVPLYYLVLIAANSWLCWFIPVFTRIMSREWKRALEGRLLPPLTEIFINATWWPWLFVCCFAICGFMSMKSLLRPSLHYHVLITAIFVEAVILFFAMCAFAIPQIRIISFLNH